MEPVFFLRFLILKKRIFLEKYVFSNTGFVFRIHSHDHDAARVLSSEAGS
jgi:hypothetical protein